LTLTPDGKELIVQRMVVKYADGTPGEWFFLWDPSIIPPASKEIWYTKTLDNPDLYFTPAVLLDKDWNCAHTMWSDYVCEIGSKNLEAVEQLIKTGVMPASDRREFFIPAGQRWSEPGWYH
jgi:hypothetical protein